MERCGVKVEILGFTTRAWKGGQSREHWLTAGKPANRVQSLRLPKLAFEFEFARHIQLDGHVIDHLSAPVAHRGDGRLLLVNRAVLSPVDKMSAPDFPALKRLPQVRVKRRVMPATLEQARVLAERFLARITRGAFKSGIGIDNGRFEVGNHDGLGGLFQRRDQTQLRFLRLAAFSDVLNLGDKVDRLFLGVPDQGNAERNPNQAPRFMEIAPLRLIGFDFAGQQAPHVPEIGGQIGGMSDLLGGFDAQLRRRITQHSAQRMIDPQPPSLA